MTKVFIPIPTEIIKTMFKSTVLATIALSTIFPLTIVSQAQASNYTTRENKVHKDNSEIVLNGVNWFGSDLKYNLAPLGLLKRNYKDVISQIKSLGFNAVRLPFCPATLRTNQVNGIDKDLNPELYGLNSLQVMDAVIDELNSRQVYILLDHHRPDCENITPLWYTSNYSEGDWLADLQFVANRYKNKSYFFGIDLKNEPHEPATWSDSSPSTDWNHAAERAGYAVLQSNPNLLVYVEGIGEAVYGDKCNANHSKFWGGNLSGLKCFGINTSYIPKDKLVLSAHTYGPDVYLHDYMKNDDYPTTLPLVWNEHFGFVISKGNTLSIGEFGGKYQPESKDKKWQDAFVDYAINNRICNTFFWSLNPESSDTGAILQDDWKTVNTGKMNNIRRLHDFCNNNIGSSNQSPQPKAQLLKQPNNLQVMFTQTGYWSPNYYCGNFTIFNNSNQKATNWRIKFDASITIAQKWHSYYESQSNGYFAYPTEEWNKSINPYFTTQFGMCYYSNNNNPIKNLVVEYNQ
jgi:endoglucanase